MAKSVTLGIFSLLFAVALSEELSFTITAEKDTVMVGDTVTLSCEGHNLGFSTLFQFDRLDKNGPPFKIGVNGNKDENIESLDRYSMALDVNTHIFTVTITGVQVEDSGTFRCGDSKDTYDEFTLTVKKEPETISLMVDGTEVDDGAEIEMKSGDTKDLKCTVAGSNPPSSVKVIVEDKKGKQVKDISGEFQMTETSEVVPMEGAAVRTFDKTLWQTVAVKDGLMVTSDFGMKYVKCEGMIEGSDNKLEKKFFVKFPGMPPVFECPAQFVSYVGEDRTNVSCVVRAQPALTGSSVTWMKGLFHNITESVSNEKPTVNRYVYHQEAGEEDAWHLSLVIHRVGMQMFRNYTFKAVNDYGSEMHTIVLNRDESQEVQSSSVAREPVLLITMAMALVGLWAQK